MTEMSNELFSELLDLLQQSTRVSGSDSIVQSIYECDKDFSEETADKCETTLKELKAIASENYRAYKDVRGEEKLWRDILKLIG